MLLHEFLDFFNVRQVVSPTLLQNSAQWRKLSDGFTVKLFTEDGAELPLSTDVLHRLYAGREPGADSLRAKFSTLIMSMQWRAVPQRWIAQQLGVHAAATRALFKHAGWHAYAPKQSVDKRGRLYINGAQDIVWLAPRAEFLDDLEVKIYIYDTFYKGGK